MKERINRLAKGIVDSDLPMMTYSPVKIEETIRINTTAKRELFIGSGNSLNVKGLIYSSNERVRFPDSNHAFGGMRNHVPYEVDTSFLAAGDQIAGSFYLVTNCGEKEIPYVFHADLTSSGGVLGELATAEDFLDAARQDMETSLRLLEYSDFTEAPFMQDLHIRAIYDGLRGHGSRQNFMEEFLVALGVKKPIRLTADSSSRSFGAVTDSVESVIRLSTGSWGFLYLEAEAEGDFLHLPVKCATQADFQDGVLELPFRILADRLHGGRNYGVIRISTSWEQLTVTVEARAEAAGRDPKRTAFRRELKRYLDLRLAFESKADRDPSLLNQMGRELDLIRMTQDQPWLLLLQAENDLLSGRQDRAAVILEEVKDQVTALRTEDGAQYCFYQYLHLNWGDPEQRDTLIRTLKRHSKEGGRSCSDFLLYLMMLRVNKELFENPGMVLLSMEQEFKDGCFSPFLYAEGLRLLESQPDLLRGLERFEAGVLYFGARRGLLSRELAFRGVRAIDEKRIFKPLYFRILTAVYEQYQETDILASICAMLIRGNRRDCRYFLWYERGVQEGISLTRLYEYFLYAIPENYGKLLPREVLLYFSYGNELSSQNRSVLYANIMEFADRESDIYRSFEREIEQFMVNQLLDGQIDGCLAVIYKTMLCRELIDVSLAETLPSVLVTNRILCHDDAMCFVVVRYEELTEEAAYPIRDGIAWVPLYSERAVILFQDIFGNRYMNVSYEKKAVMSKQDELLEICFEVYPRHLMLLAGACHRAADRKDLTEDEVSFLEQADQETGIHPLFHKKLLSAIIGYYKKLADCGEGDQAAGAAYLRSLNKDILTRAERNGVCETLIRLNYDTDAYDMICRYGCEGVSAGQLLKLCARMILKKLFDEDDRLLSLSFQVFQSGQCDSVILDYLCEHFNGTVDQMYRILTRAIGDHVETYDLEERLVAQMLFTGCAEKMDKVFDLYASRKKTSEAIVKAYFTVKSMDYFLNHRATEDKVFAYLEGAVNSSVEKDRVPEIYLLALTRYYSTLTALTDDQKKLCQAVVDVLIEAGMIFACFKSLSRFIVIPGNILDKEIIEYHGRKDVKPWLKLRILPEEEDFHLEAMRQVYRGIYVREKVLFEGERLEYQILEEEDQELIKRAEGCIACSERPAAVKGNRFDCLNEMSLSLKVKNGDALRVKMQEYIKKDAAVAALFPIQ